MVLSTLFVFILSLGASIELLESRQEQQSAGTLRFGDFNTTLISVNDHADNTQRNISYHTTSDGLIIVNGDEVYPGAEEDLKAGRLSGANPKEKRAASLSSMRNWWPRAIVRYKYDGEDTRYSQKDNVDTALSLWKDAAPWIRFQRLPNGGPENGVLRITSTRCDGCNAAVGYDDSRPLSMNLQSGGGECTHNTKCGWEEALHEFGHVLGMFY